MVKSKFLVIILLFVYTNIFTQTNDTLKFTKLLNKIEGFSTKPQIGLALSGGAAHGLAHIGVIKYLEERGIGFDYITGTSMGSIVGGLLAMGYNAQQLEKIASFQNWKLILSNTAPLNEIAPLEKSYHNKFPIRFEYKNSKFSLPRGFISGQKMDLLINRLFAPTYAIDDFDKLPIPFKCFAVNIETGDVIALDRGFLGSSIRASMAIPSVFNPVEMDGQLLVDGGLIRNFPVIENIEMGADLVIGVYVGSKLEKKEKLNSLLDILRQSASMYSIKDSEYQRELVDLFIEPPTKDMDSFEFDSHREFIKRGYEEAKKYKVEIDAIAEKIKEYEQHQKESLKLPNGFKAQKINLEGVDESFRYFVGSKLSIKEGSKFSLHQLEQDISNIYGTKNFSNITYSLDQIEGNDIELKIKADDKQLIELGANMNYFYSSSAALILNAEFRNTILKPSRINLTARISQMPGAAGDMIFRLGREQSFSIGFSGLFDRYQMPLIHSNSLLGEYDRVDKEAKVRLDYEPNNKLNLELNLSASEMEFQRSIIRVTDFDNYDQNKLRAGLGISLNNLDDAYLATKGQSIVLNSGYNFNRSVLVEFSGEGGIVPDLNITNFFDLNARLFFAKRLSEQIISHSMINMIYTSESLPLEAIGFGGSTVHRRNNFGFIGAQEFEYNLHKAVNLSQAFYYCFSENVFFGTHINYLNGSSAFSEYLVNDFNDDFSVFGYGLSLKYLSFLGPIEFNIGVGGESINSSFSVGHRFIF